MTVEHNISQDMPSAMADLISLIENEIPEGRQNLIDSHSNLDKVADYCETNYFQSDNKRSALEETKNYTTQSLASVAYQVNTLAYNLLHMLDLQTAQLAEMESQINHISQTVDIHKEKVARREIGILTSNKSTVRQHKILVPANPERPIKYIRKPIDYSVLDDIGHGVKIASQNAPRSKSYTLKNGSGTLMMSSGPAPTTKPPTPPQTIRNVGSLSRGNKEYRTPAPPIAPPQVPSNYAPNYPLGHPKAIENNRRGSGYSTLPLGLGHQSGVIQQHNLMQQMSGQNHSHYSQSTQGSQQGQPIVPPSPTPPPPPPPLHEIPMLSPISDSLPDPPPMHLQHNQHNDHYERHSNASPPLPPPPSIDDNHHMNVYNMEHIPQTMNGYRERHNQEPDWVPNNYLEKVVAIYDYNADKDDELSFQENSVIYVIRKNDDGWYEGVMDGITGLFPGNYVEPCI
ncbi:abl interactor 2-like isoform X2 [Oppia nitens]|uniref:abl interactor 2-like isoform X2 n=1 Tax=Oppia nitens TaxID=1686743 RepID=UPI0023DBCC8E|nr:abl interactor 2-like isoform X2 [Oppia nitens]